MTIGVAVAPVPDRGLEDAVRTGGAEVVGPVEADGLVWTDPGDPGGLAAALAGSGVRWVQLPFAGIERFVGAGVVDDERVWTCAKGIYGRATAEHALALMLAGARLLHVHARAAGWRGRSGAGAPERMLKGARVVLVGTGGIGTALAGLLAPFEVELVAVSRSGRPMPGAAATVPREGLHDVLAEADHVVLAAALTAATRGMIGRPELARMSSGAWLVNVARGGLVDTVALVAALTQEAIAGAALDVTEPEPLPDDHPLWSLPNVLITPHVANTWDMALPELRALVARNVARFVAGDPLEGVVDPALGY